MTLTFQLPEQPGIGTVVRARSGDLFHRTPAGFWHRKVDIARFNISVGSNWGTLLAAHGPVEVVSEDHPATDPIGTVRCSHAPAYLAVTSPGVMKRRWVEIGTGNHLADDEIEGVPVVPRSTLATFLPPEAALEGPA